MEEQIIYANALNHLSGLGAVTINKLIAKFGDAKSVWQLPESTLDNLGLARNIRASFNEREKYSPQKLYGSLAKHNIRALALGTDKYPSLLAEIYDPPPLLYCRGDINLLETPSLTIVGTRKASSYGNAICEHFVSRLARAGITITSGMAFGIDTTAHQAALARGGTTIAVLASGLDLDVIYPRNNLKLAEEIIEHGLLISERPPGIYPQKHNFPMRNRIASGIAKAVLVVEAPAKSGALVTARCALEQNRDVFAVPGEIGHPNSIGTNNLIKEGAAQLASEPEDLLIAFNVTVSQNSREQKINLTNTEQKIYNALLYAPMTLDELKIKTGFTTQALLTNITTLELKRAISRDNNTFNILL